METQTKTRLFRYKDPKIVGPGVWWVGHMLCETAVLDNTVNSFILAYKFIVAIKENFPCIMCRDHIHEYCEKYDPSNFKPLYDAEGNLTEKHDAEGLALWFYNLHNSANEHSKSQGTEDYDDVVKFFRTDEGECDAKEDCGSVPTEVVKEYSLSAPETKHELAEIKISEGMFNLSFID